MRATDRQGAEVSKGFEVWTRARRRVGLKHLKVGGSNPHILDPGGFRLTTSAGGESLENLKGDNFCRPRSSENLRKRIDRGTLNKSQLLSARTTERFLIPLTSMGGSASRFGLSPGR